MNTQGFWLLLPEILISNGFDDDDEYDFEYDYEYMIMNIMIMNTSMIYDGHD